MLTLGIETTCDETACAIVRDRKEILASVVSSQIDLHKAYGGVVPELASRRHVDLLVPIYEETLARAQLLPEALDLIAVSHRPGLIGALLVGLNFAKGLSLGLQKPLIGVNHVYAHLYAPFMQKDSPPLPALGLVISGGHTALFLLQEGHDPQLISQTVDDAIGEAFDKCARLLGLPYPGGPEIEKLALQGNPQRFPMRAGRVKTDPLAFSYSGLKTAVLYTLQKLPDPTRQDKADLAASFQEAAFASLLDKTLPAAETYGLSHLVIGGGVSNSHRLRLLFAEKAPQLVTHWPQPLLTTDNGAMIAGEGTRAFLIRGQVGDSLSLNAFPTLL